MGRPRSSGHKRGGRAKAAEDGRPVRRMGAALIEKPAKSGIIGKNRPKEIPDMGRTKALTAKDVTREYLDAAAPGQGTVTYDDGYQIKTHRAELEMAGWLHCTFGGDIQLLKESDVKNQETPDFLWRQKMWELKGASSINGADKLLQHGIKQIQDNPGGVILNVLGDLDMAELEKQLMRRFLRSGSVNTLDLMILSKGALVKILRHKK